MREARTVARRASGPSAAGSPAAVTARPRARAAPVRSAAGTAVRGVSSTLPSTRTRAAVRSGYRRAKASAWNAAIECPTTVTGPAAGPVRPRASSRPAIRRASPAVVGGSVAGPLRPCPGRSKRTTVRPAAASSGATGSQSNQAMASPALSTHTGPRPSTTTCSGTPSTRTNRPVPPACRGVCGSPGGDTDGGDGVTYGLPCGRSRRAGPARVPRTAPAAAARRPGPRSRARR